MDWTTALHSMLSPGGLCFSTQWNVGRTVSTFRHSVIWQKSAADPAKNCFFSFSQLLGNSPLGTNPGAQQSIAGFHYRLTVLLSQLLRPPPHSSIKITLKQGEAQNQDG